MLANVGGTTVPSPALAPLALMVTMDAKKGVQLIRLRQPGLKIPIHYDDYDVCEPPARFSDGGREGWVGGKGCIFGPGREVWVYR